MTAVIRSGDVESPEGGGERHQNEQKKGWIRTLWPWLARHKKDVYLAFGVAIVGMVIAALTPVVEKVLLDNITLHPDAAIWPWLVLLVLAGVIRFGAAYVRRFYGGRVALSVQHDLRTAIYDTLQRLDFARHDELQTGQLVSRASSDVALLQGLLAFLPIISGNLVMLVISLVIMLILSPVLTLVALAVVPLLFVVALRMRSSVFPASWDAQQEAAMVAGVVDESVTGVRVVKGFGQEGRELGRLTDRSHTLFRSRMRLVRIQALYVPTLQALPAFGQVAVLALGGWLALHGHITLGTFLAFSSYLVQLASPARMFAGLVAVGQQARAGAERIFELLDSNPLVTESPDAKPLPTVRGQLDFEDVRFGYMRSEPVLDGFTLHVHPGEVVALVGASGSGKSTTSLLLPRFYDVQEGSVRIDGADVRDVTLDSLRHQIGVVFEESFLFSDSIRNNIAFGVPDATFDDVIGAAKAAEAHEFILALPDGYDTVVGERGLTLSGGQRQRVALARALLTDPHILILDDATSSVDARVEEEIHATLRRLLQDRTTLLIAHRRSTLRLADRIAVVDNGHVVDSGTHDELMVRCTLYRRLLAGPGDDCETEEIEEVADPVTLTASAWQPVDGNGNGNGNGNGANRPLNVDAQARIGGGGGGGGGWGGGGGMVGSFLAPTPELLEKVAKLPPATDDPEVDVDREGTYDPSFTLRRFTRPFRRPLTIGLGLVVLDTLFTLAGPTLIRLGVDKGVTDHSTQALWVVSAVFFVITLLDWADTYAYTRYTGRTAERLLFALRVRIFAHLQRLDLGYYDSEMAGRIMTRMTTDVEALSTLLQTGLINAVVNLLTFGGVAIILILTNFKLSLAAMVIVPPLIAATVWFRNGSQRAYERARDRIAAVNANLQESLSGVRVSQAFVREERNQEGFRQVATEYLDARMDAQRMVATYFPFVEFLSEVAAAAVLGLGAYLVAHHGVSPGSVIAFLLYLDLFFSPIQQLSQVFDTYQQARASMQKIDELMRTPTGTPPPVEPEVPGRLTGRITFDDVHFAYPSGFGEALAGVDIEITPGETIALVGETGAGKSTIVKLVARFYDATSGRVLIDGTDIRDLDLTAYRQQLGYVPQEAFLFSGTIRDNIAYGRPDASNEEVEEAARAVGAHEFIATLPGGYFYEVSERGRALSSGQRQLIALARARLVDPRILLLDEATSNLDLGTEAKVQRAMGIVASGRTTLLIAHRLQTARTADRILVVDGGKIAAHGTHDELLADRDSPYARMWRAFAVEAPTT
jgi:ATP-binding cassette, subfamily B, bacterial